MQLFQWTSVFKQFKFRFIELGIRGLRKKICLPSGFEPAFPCVGETTDVLGIERPWKVFTFDKCSITLFKKYASLVWLPRRQYLLSLLLYLRRKLCKRLIDFLVIPQYFILHQIIFSGYTPLSSHPSLLKSVNLRPEIPKKL